MAKQESKEKKTLIILFTSLRGLKHYSWLSSVTSLQSKRDKNNCSKSSFVQTSSMNEDKIFHKGSMKKLVVETTIYEK